MKKIVSFIFWLLLFIVGVAGFFYDGPPGITFRKDTLLIEAANGPHTFNIEVAETPEQQEQGLMQRKTMGGDEGMLFLFPPEYVPQMWMKNTLLPLDMLFIDNDGKIMYIAQDAVPGSEEIISANRNTRAVLELPAGTAAALKIEAGDRIVHSAFATVK